MTDIKGKAEVLKEQGKVTMDTSVSKYTSIIGLACAILILVSSVASGIMRNMPAFVVILVFVTVALTQYTSKSAEQFEIIYGNEGLVINELFKRNKYYSYEQISRITDEEYNRMTYLVAYDTNDARIFRISRKCIGYEEFASYITERCNH